MADRSLNTLRFRFWFFLMAAFSAVLIFLLSLVYLIFAHALEQEVRERMSSPDFLEAFREREDFFSGEGQEWLLVADPQDLAQAEGIFGGSLSGHSAFMEEQFSKRGTRPQTRESTWLDLVMGFLDLSRQSFVSFQGRYYSSAFMERFEELNPHLEFVFVEAALQAMVITKGTAFPEAALETAVDEMMETPLLIVDLEYEDGFSLRPSFSEPLLWNTVVVDAPLPVSLSLILMDVTEDVLQLYALRDTLLSLGGAGLLVIAILSFLFAYLLTIPIQRTLLRQKQFIADASHELKTPLAIMRSNYDVLLSNPSLSVASQMEWLEYMGFGFDRMNHLTRDLLLLAKLESLPLKKQRFEVNGLLEMAVKTMAVKVKGGGVIVDTSIQPALWLNHDPEKLLQVLVILLDNAVKYAGEGGWVKVSALKKGRKTLIKVSNSGPGIPRKDLGRIFERFYRVEDSRSSDHGSFGLGLSIAWEIIRKGGGKLMAESIPGQETTFTLKI